METEASISKTDLITILVLAPIIETIPLAVVGWMIQRTGLPLWSFLTISGVAHFFLHGGDLVDLEIAAIFIALALVWWIARRRYGGAYAFGLTAIAHAGINSFVVSARLL